ncbi:ParB/RepB/Spo0J family partition protein [Brevundimonas sp. CEF1]|uniref:ParB/RepB/Spo0J family partition protein n=1 Tax=Brevundimonas sp. CEF1 TaxID=3442642 RepID=UPI003F50E99C
MQMSPISSVAELGVEVIAPLSKCRIAPENIRQAPLDFVDDETVALAESVASKVRMIQRPVAYEEDGLFQITAGGRRLRSVLYLKGQKRLPAEYKAGLPLILRSKEDAVEISIAENNIRLAATPAQELSGFRLLAGKGLDPVDIARMTGNREAHVKRMLRLTQVSPRVLEAFDRQDIDLDALRAFSASSDLARQDEILEAGMFRANQVRAAITSGSVRATDYRVKLIGLDAYRSAGGRVEEDLFQDSVYLLDVELLDQLAEQFIRSEAAKLEAEGWQSVIVQDNTSVPSGHRQHWLKAREMTSVEAEEYAQAEQVLEREDATEEELTAAEAVVARIDAAITEVSAEDKAGISVVMGVQYGHINVFYAVPVEATGDGPSTSSNPAKKQAPAFGHAGHERMTQIATVAIRNGLASDPAAALDALVSHQAWTCFRAKSAGTSYALPNARPARCSDVECEGANLKGDDAFASSYERWSTSLPADMVELYDYVEKLGHDDKLSLLALCTAMQVNGVEVREDAGRPEAWRQIGLLARRINLDISEQWTPNEDFFTGANKQRLLATLSEMEVDVVPLAAEKKGALVTIAAKAARMKRWVPGLIAVLGQNRAQAEAG